MANAELPELQHQQQQQLQKRRQQGSSLLGFDNFVRENPQSDLFHIKRFAHIELICGDAENTYRRFLWGLGMRLVAKSDLTTGNARFASFVLQSHELQLVFTSPYGESSEAHDSSPSPLPHFCRASAFDFFRRHGLAVRSVGIEVQNCVAAHQVSVSCGAKSVLPPTVLVDKTTGGSCTIAEVCMHHEASDTVIRWIEPCDFMGPYLPNYASVNSAPHCIGLTRIDHVVSNVWHLGDQLDYLARMTGMHRFAEFTSEDIGTVNSGLNSVVLANNDEMVLLPCNEPTFGTRLKSQIQTFLEQNCGPGIQHIAIMTDDIAHTVGELRRRSHVGGFEFMPSPGTEYYRKLPRRIGGALTDGLLRDLERLGILADKDDRGVLLQIFTKPVGDRPTLFFEIIQRIGCEEVGADGSRRQRGGCGGFGKGNISELFKSVEQHVSTLTDARGPHR